MTRNLLHLHLSRRESQVMDVIYQLGEATVSEVVQRMPDDPPYNSVRNTLAILERKGYLQHRRDGARYVYLPAVEVDNARQSAAKHLVQTFFGGSLSQAFLAILGTSNRDISQEDLDEMAAAIERARKKTR